MRHQRVLPERIKRVGFISTRIAGTDGVSLEIQKWDDVLTRMGMECYYIAGELDRPEDRCFLLEEAAFTHPQIREITAQAFGHKYRNLATTRAIHETAWRIKKRLYEMQVELNLDLLIPENALTIPMNIPLGIALVEFFMENRLAVIAHHHDFYWERERFLTNAVEDYLRMAFPPGLSHIQHVVINTVAGEQLSFRTGLSSTVVPNVMDFEAVIPEMDDYARHFRADVGLSQDDWLILQPTRVVQRKGIEHAIELVKRLEDPRAKMVISHSAGDEGHEYAQRVRNYAALLGVEVISAADIVGDDRETLPDGRRRYTIRDVYLNADLITYPSTYEGFGNAFLEAILYKRPIVCNRYSIYRTDIEPLGFDVIEMDGFVTDKVVQETRRVLEDAEYRESMVRRNFKLGRRFFSYDVVKNKLEAILTGFRGAVGEPPSLFEDLFTPDTMGGDVY